VHCKYIPIYIQQDAALHSLFISGNCSACFGWYFHPSSRAHTTVSTASGICHNVTAICRYRGRVGTGLSVLWVAWQIPDAVDTVVCAPDDGWKYHPKHVEQFPGINKLCNVASCWIYIGILLGAHNILHISRIRVNVVTHLQEYSCAYCTYFFSVRSLNLFSSFKVSDQFLYPYKITGEFSYVYFQLYLIR